MDRRVRDVVAMGCFTLATNLGLAQPPAAHRYPPAHRGGQVDDLHGVRIADPYRWLEDVNSPETQTWVASENTLTDSVLARAVDQSALRARLTRLWDYAKLQAPFSAGDRLFFWENSGLENQPALYVHDR